MIISNNYLHGIKDEANLDPDAIMSVPGEGLKISLPHPTSMIMLSAAILWVVDDTDLQKELLIGYEYKELLTGYGYTVELTWPDIIAPDWRVAV